MAKALAPTPPVASRTRSAERKELTELDDESDAESLFTELAGQVLRPLSELEQQLEYYTQNGKKHGVLFTDRAIEERRKDRLKLSKRRGGYTETRADRAIRIMDGKVTALLVDIAQAQRLRDDEERAEEQRLKEQERKLKKADADAKRYAKRRKLEREMERASISIEEQELEIRAKELGINVIQGTAPSVE